ncbi:MAG: hypothetical protein LBH76_02445 [Propionibacteriaceae bacterium]|jgi:hypothetical protein|nr:hypothetical protein [Propionibacteriaceae bacterium]
MNAPPQERSAHPRRRSFRAAIALAASLALGLGAWQASSFATAETEDDPGRIVLDVVSLPAEFTVDGSTVTPVIEFRYEADPQPEELPTYEWQWLRDGEPVPEGGTGSEYRPDLEDHGHDITVEVTASLPPLEPAVMTSEAMRVTARNWLSFVTSFQLDGEPAEDAEWRGPVEAGQTVTAVTSAMYYDADGDIRVLDAEEFTEPSYQWTHVTDDGTELIEGAVGASYTPTLDDVGYMLGVEVETEATDIADVSTRFYSYAIAVTEPPVVEEFAIAQLELPETAEAGATLTPVYAFSGLADGQEPDLAWQWFRDDEAIEEQTDSSYQTVETDAGCSLSVQLTASLLDGEPLVQLSNATAVTAVETPQYVINAVALREFEIIGEANIGLEYDAVLPDDVVISFQWLRNGEPIEGAVNDTYDTTADDFGTYLSVEMTASIEGQDDLRAVSSVAVVFYPEPVFSISEILLPEEIDGIAEVVAEYDSNLPDNAVVSFQWLRDNEPIEGAVDQAYTTTEDDFGYPLSVEVRAEVLGHPAIQVLSSSANVLCPAPRVINLEVVSEAADSGFRTGVTISAFFVVEVAESPFAGSVVAEWLRDGEPIADERVEAVDGAFSTSYQLTAADVGHEIAVAITAQAEGSMMVTETSSPITPELGRLAITRVTAFGPVHVGSTVKANYDTVQDGPEAPAATWQWNRDGEPIDGATTQSYTVTEDDRGTVLSVTLTVALDGFEDAVRTSAGLPVTVWTAAVDSAPASEDSTDLILTASVPDLPEGSTVAYQWSKNGLPIDGAVDAAYQVADDGEHPQFSVRVTVTDEDGVSVSQAHTVTPYGTPTIGEMISRIIDLLIRVLSILMDILG